MTRYLFYCHDVTGSGHIVRTLPIGPATPGRERECMLVIGCAIGYGDTDDWRAITAGRHIEVSS